MATISRIIPTPEEPAPLTPQQREIKDLTVRHDRTLSELVNGVMGGYISLWGKPGSMRDRIEVEAILNTDVASAVRLFTNHAGIIAALEAGGMVTFDDWEKTTPYKAAFNDDGTIALSETLTDAWVVPEEKPAEVRDEVRA